MSKPSDVSTSDIEKKSEGSPDSSDKSSNHSRDVNLNSKKFADCNLVGNGPIKNGGNGSIEPETKERKKRKDEESDLIQDEKNNELDNSISINKTNNQSFTTHISTPKPGSAGSQMPCSLSSISTVDDVELENSDETYIVPKPILSRNSSLSHEEIGKKFQDLSFAFKTDSMSIQKRLSLLKRRIDQAEINIENDVKSMKSKLEGLKQFNISSDYIDLLTDLSKQLSFVLNAVVQLSSSAEAYGYAQHEEQSLEFVTVMVQHVENLESLKLETSKMLDKFKIEGKSNQNSASFDNIRDDERLLRRRSVASMAEGTSRRRASIATFALGSTMLDGVANGKGSQNLASSRSSGTIAKKSLVSNRIHSTSLPGIDDIRRESIGSRHRVESRTNEGSMQNIEESPERRSSSNAETDPLNSSNDPDGGIDASDSSLRQLYQSIEEVRRNSTSQESLNVIYCLRRIVEWNKLLLSFARFRRPEHVLHYVPFYITWYVIFILVLVFAGGLLTGINGCCTYLRLKQLGLWFLLLTFFLLPRRVCRVLLSLCIILLFSFALLVFFLVQVVFPGLSDDDFNKLFNNYGFVLKVRYPNGPPPV